MGKTNHKEHQTDGDVLLSRLASTTLPAALKKPAADFKTAHLALAAARDAARTARTVRDEALAAVGVADDALDAAVNVLADKMAGAQMGTRKSPFASVSKYSPSDVTGLAYADEVKEVLALTAKVKKAKPPADVAKAAAACEKQANAVASALAKMSKPQLAYAKSLAARDALLPTWAKSLSRLKKNAAAAWFDDQASYDAVFAAPERVLAPVHPRAKKAKPAATTAAPTNGVPASPLPTIAPAKPTP
jgi:hypothetical protein